MDQIGRDPRIAEVEEKLRAERDCGKDLTPGPAGAVGVRMLTLAEVARNQADFHGGAADRAARLARFLEANPAFEEFINLIRAGAIRL